MKAFPPVVLRGDLQAAKNHRGTHAGDSPNTGRRTFVLSGVFIAPSNQLNIRSKLEQMGFTMRATVDHTTAILVYSSEIDAAVVMPAKLAAAVEREVPFILNEAAACELFGSIFAFPKAKREALAAKAKAEAEGQPCGQQRDRTGKSSRLAMACILDAWGSPGKVVRIHDHFGSSAADRNLACMIHDMIGKLGLRGFEVERRLHEPTVVFHGY